MKSVVKALKRQGETRLVTRQNSGENMNNKAAAVKVLSLSRDFEEIRYTALLRGQ